MSAHKWAIRVLIVFVLVAPLSLFVFGPAQSGPIRESDTQKVYDKLNKEYDYHDLNKWCGLRLSDAKPNEVAQIWDAIESAENTKDFLCKTPLTSSREAMLPRSSTFSKNIAWDRLSHISDRSKWIGIGVYKYPIGNTDFLIVCRVAIGFKPDTNHQAVRWE